MIGSDWILLQSKLIFIHCSVLFQHLVSRDVIFRRTAFQLGSDILSALEPFRAEPFEMAPAQLYIEPKWSRISKLFK